MIIKFTAYEQNGKTILRKEDSSDKEIISLIARQDIELKFKKLIRNNKYLKLNLRFFKILR